MSYIAKRQRTRRVKRGMGSIEGMIGNAWAQIAGTAPPSATVDVITSDSTECLPAADAATAALDAKWYDIAQNWNPTGNFSPADMDKAITATVKALSDAQVAVMFAPQTTRDAGEQIAQAIDSIGKRLQQMAPYATAVQDAKNTGATVINSPNFKQWITGSLVDVSAAYATRAVLECQVSWLQTAQDAIDAVRSIVMRIVDVVVKAADTVLNVTDDIFDAYKYIKYGAIALGVWWLVNKMKKSAA